MGAPLGPRDRTLQASAAGFRMLFERAPIGLVQVDAQGHILAANTAAQQILGYSEHEFRQLNVGDVTHPDDRALGWALFGDVLAGTSDSYTMDKRYLHKDGRIVWGQLTVSAMRDEHGMLTSIVAMVLDKTEQKRTEHVLEQARSAAEELAAMRQQQAEEALAMAAVGAALASTLDPGTIYQVILAQAARILPSDNSVIVLYQDGWVVVGAARGGPDIAPGTTMGKVQTDTNAWYVLRRGQPLLLSNTADVPDWVDPAPWRGPYQVRSAIVVPMLIDGELMGSFQLNSYRPDFFTIRHVPIANAFGERATQAVRNARLYAAEQERTRVAEELAQLRQEQAQESEAMSLVSAALASALEPGQIYTLILDQVHRVLPYDHASVLLFRDGWATVVGSQGHLSVPVGSRVFALADIASIAAFGWEGKPARISDTADLSSWVEVPPFTGAQRIRSVIVVPLVVDGTTVGTFTVDSFTPNFYTASHLGVAIAFAERILQALRNAQLFAAEHAARARAERLAALQNDFVASVSHELRTPLTSIIGFGELLRARWYQLSDAKRLERVGSIVLAANRQQRLVDDLLLSSRLESTNVVPTREIRSVAELVRQAVEEVRGSHPGQHIDQIGSSDLQVHIDAAHTIQILTNLIDNAAKYSPEGSAIRVRWTHEKDFAVLRVEDHGPGVPAVGREQLFTRFGRLPGSSIRAGRVGTGLGLHISRGLAEAMGGSLDLETTGSGGSIFRLRLPDAPGQPADL